MPASEKNSSVDDKKVFRLYQTAKKRKVVKTITVPSETELSQWLDEAYKTAGQNADLDMFDFIEKKPLEHFFGLEEDGLVNDHYESDTGTTFELWKIACASVPEKIIPESNRLEIDDYLDDLKKLRDELSEKEEAFADLWCAKINDPLQKFLSENKFQ